MNFSQSWHTFEEITPDANTDIWFVINGNLFVGVYEEDKDGEWIVMADNGAFPIKAAEAWRYVMEAPMRRFPEDGEIVACELIGTPGLVTGIFTEDYYDEDKDESVGPSVKLNDIYNVGAIKPANKEGVVEAGEINCFLAVPDMPN